MPTVNTYLLGAVVETSGVFTDMNGAPVDPTTITFRIREPDTSPAVTVYVFGVDAELVRDDVGEYHVDWETSQAGEHCYRFEGTGAARAVNEKKFEVEDGCFAEA